MQRRTEDRAAERIAARIGPAMPQNAAHVRVELAQLGLAAMRDQLADSLERDLLFDLSLGDEADRLPVGRRRLAAAFGVCGDVVVDAIAKRARDTCPPTS